MAIIVPSWFKARQCKAEPHGGEADGVLKVSGPNLGEAYLRVEPAGPDRWRAALRLAADGPDVAAADAGPKAKEAWEVAFELYRTHVIV